jgi:predicted enzyme related to lactoylglutathione lyase
VHGELTFFEIGVPHSERAQAFYGRLFGWEFPPTGEDDQVSVKTPTIKAGLHDHDDDARIGIYFSVDDIEAAVAAVRDLGGSAEDPRPEEPGFGRFTACTDDQGVKFGLRQPAR